MKSGTKHTRLACMYCGCTENRACAIPRDEIDIVSQDALLERFQVESVDELPKLIGCWWISTSPPVCSANVCVMRYQAARTSPRMKAKRS